MGQCKEKIYVLRIYKLLLAILLIGPLFSSFIANTTLLRSCELFCLLYALYILLRHFIFKRVVVYHGYAGGLILCLFLVSVGIVWRGHWPVNVKDILLTIITPNRFLVYILPFFLLFIPNRRYLDDILVLFYKASLFVIPLWLINWNDLVQKGTYTGEHIGAFLPFFSAFLLGFLPVLSKRQRYVTIAIWSIFFLLMLLNARRNVSFSLALYALIAYVFTVLSNIRRNPIKYFLIVLVSMIGLLALQINMDRLASGTFSNMAHRVGEDSRSGVEELFFLDFINSPIEDWIFGRGMDGGYLQEVVNEQTGEISDRREIIETGYLNMILKGGILYVGIILLMMFYAILSRRILYNKKNGYILMILCTYFIDLYATNPVCIFSVRSIIFWFIVSLLMQENRKNSYYIE